MYQKTSLFTNVNANFLLNNKHFAGPNNLYRIKNYHHKKSFTVYHFMWNMLKRGYVGFYFGFREMYSYLRANQRFLGFHFGNDD